MTPQLLRKGAKATAFVFFANLVLVPFVQAEELAQRRAKEAMSFMHDTGVMSSAWADQRKSMETLKQKVKDSRLDLDKNGVGFYRKKAKVMVDLERQRLRRAVKFLLDNNHGDRFTSDLRKSGQGELVDLANNIEVGSQNGFTAMERTASASEVTDNYLSFRMKGYSDVVTGLKAADVRKVMVDTEEAADDYVKSGGDTRMLNRGMFARGEEGTEEEGKSKVIRWLIGAIAGVGLIIAVFFSFTTMTITPFLTFMATVSGLVALLGRTSQFQSTFYGNPYGPTPGPFNPYNPWNPYTAGGGFQGFSAGASG